MISLYHIIWIESNIRCYDKLPNTSSWRFFQVLIISFRSVSSWNAFPDQIDIAHLLKDRNDQWFVGIKVEGMSMAQWLHINFWVLNYSDRWKSTHGEVDSRLGKPRSRGETTTSLNFLNEIPVVDEFCDLKLMDIIQVSSIITRPNFG